ncbi:MAG TPA: NifU family protein [Polyangiaceae bacterium]
MDESAKDQIAKVCREILAPLVRTDGGELYLVRFDGDDLHIFLSGTCAGCPGASLTGDKVILPALRSAAPKIRLVVTTGVKAPEGAQKM